MKTKIIKEALSNIRAEIAQLSIVAGSLQAEADQLHEEADAKDEEVKEIDLKIERLEDHVKRVECEDRFAVFGSYWDIFDVPWPTKVQWVPPLGDSGSWLTTGYLAIRWEDWVYPPHDRELAYAKTAGAFELPSDAVGVSPEPAEPTKDSGPCVAYGGTRFNARRAAFCASRGGDPMMAPGGATLYFVLDGEVTAVLAGLKA